MKFIKSIKKKLKKRRIATKNARNFPEITRYLIAQQAIQERALISTEPLISDTLHSKKGILVSITTYSTRIHTVHLAIESMGRQTIKPNKLILWLDEDEFNINTIPLVIKRQMERGLEVRFCKNYRSYKKIVPSIGIYPDFDIIAIDDDLIHPHDSIEQLVYTSSNNPGAIIGQRAHDIKLSEEGCVLPYKKWAHEATQTKNTCSTFITTGHGTLFPSTCLSKIFENNEEFMELAPYADDVWVNLIAIKNDIPRVNVKDSRIFKLRFLHIPDDTDIGLNIINVAMGRNDEQILKLTSKYPEIEKKLRNSLM